MADELLHGLPPEIAGGLAERWRFQRIPMRMWDPIAAYIMLGRIPGDFLQAVICNEFAAAALRADTDNVNNLRAFAGFFETYAPPTATGSRAAMARWHELGGLVGAKEAS